LLRRSSGDRNINFRVGHAVHEIRHQDLSRESDDLDDFSSDKRRRRSGLCVGTEDSVRRDLNAMADMSGAQLKAMMLAHRVRVMRLLQTRPSGPLSSPTAAGRSSKAQGARSGNASPGMMTLIALGVSVAFSGAVTLGYPGMPLWEELATLVTIMLLGFCLQVRSISQAQGALGALAKLLPNIAS
jgi:cation transport ATPase